MNKMWKFASGIKTSLTTVCGKAFSSMIDRPQNFVLTSRLPLLTNNFGALSYRRSFYGLAPSLSAFFLPTLAAGIVPVSVRGGFLSAWTRGMATLQQMHITGPHRKKRNKCRPLDGRPMMKGVVLKTVIKKPRKPNSANRKCVIVRLSNGKEMTAYVPGEGHNLQEHNLVLVRVGRLQDVPGVKIKVIRGKYDCAPVIKKTVVK